MPGEFATSISCMDGRIQGPLQDWIRSTCGVDYVDTITEPGIDKSISDGVMAASVRAKAEISVRAHGSKNIIVSGHHDCAANPASEQEHADMIRRAVSVVSSWNLGVEVAGVWVGPSWQVTRIGA